MIKDYESLLQGKKQTSRSAEFWNQKALDFSRRFADLEKSKDTLIFDNEQLLKVFASSDSVLDVGCGIGRHAYHFAKYYPQYLGVDSSEGMIAKALENKDKYQLDNCQFKQMNWRDCQQNSDLVFASMCPDIISVADIEKLLQLSNRYLVIKRFLSDRDSLLDYLDLESNAAHNSAAYNYALLNILWQLGYMPTVITSQHEWQEEYYSLEEALDAYDYKLNKLDINERNQRVVDLKIMLKDSGVIKSKRKSEYAVTIVDKKIKNAKLEDIKDC